MNPLAYLPRWATARRVVARRADPQRYTHLGRWGIAREHLRGYLTAAEVRAYLECDAAGVQVPPGDDPVEAARQLGAAIAATGERMGALATALSRRTP